MDDQYRMPILAEMDCLLDLATIAAIGPSGITVRSNNEIVQFTNHRVVKNSSLPGDCVGKDAPWSFG
jgi:hypothetical protein